MRNLPLFVIPVIASGGAAFSPTSVTGSLFGWDFSKVASLDVSADGEAIGSAADQSGNSRDLSQATAGSKPLLKLNIQNGLSVARFDNSDDFLSLSSLNCGKANSIFAVVIPRGAMGGDVLLGSSSGSDYFMYIDGIDIYHVAGGSLVGVTRGAFTVGVPYLMGIVRSGTSVKFYKNGAQLGTTQTLGVDADLTLTTMGAVSDPALFWNGDICEAWGYNSALSDANRQALEAYWNTKWNLGF